jgi:methylated-DNA-[protein]-cysteine S-methyltransferase
MEDLLHGQPEVAGQLEGGRQRGVVTLARARTVGTGGDNGPVTALARDTGLAWDALPSPVGEISLTCSPSGLAEVRFGPPPAAADQARPHPSAPAAGEACAGARRDPAAAYLARARAQLAEYFAGLRHTFELPVDWSRLSPAQHQVLPVLLDTVGYGETLTYGGLARRAGMTDGSRVPAARVVGQIMGSNPYPIIVPCHRVVAGDGLGGYSGGGGTEIKRWLLIFEGALPPTLDWDPAGPRIGK